MKIQELLKCYRNDSMVQTIAETMKPNENLSLKIQGLVGSLSALMVSALYSIHRQNHLIVLHDKEEATYFHDDLQNLLQEKEILFFPASYKHPYEFEEVENANVLMRAEILNRINHKTSSGEIIVTYPEALIEQVINKRSLTQNTFSAEVGEQIDVAFLAELLTTYDFEKTDFVYEAGQYAVRGGIIDVFSFAKDLPYRIELFGNQIESIRIFDPISQLSEKSIRQVNIIPNIQTRLIKEERQAFLDFVPDNTKVWFKDYKHILDTIDRYFQKASSSFQQILKQSGGSHTILKPEDLFETSATFCEKAKKLVKIEFGNRFYLNHTHRFALISKPQPSFNKNFDLLLKDVYENKTKGFTTLVCAESSKQLERLENIFRELDFILPFQGIHLGLSQGFIDDTLKIACYTDHQIFERFYRYKVKDKPSKTKALTLKELHTLNPGDFVTHIDHGIGRFAGLDKRMVNDKAQEVIRLIYRNDDLLYVSIHGLHKISKYSGQEGTTPAISRLGSPEWEKKKKKVKRKVVEIANELIELYAKRKQASGFAYSKDSFLQAELESSFLYEDTPDQMTCVATVKEDMEQPHPMDRLVCGDVGFGKTEIAIRAAFKAVTDNKQVAILVPTTILATQHFRTFSERLKNFPVKIEYINRFKTTKQIKETLQHVKKGTVQILIGTHRIVNKDVEFKDLGLIIIDEEQKFGVKVKEKLKEIRIDVDYLTLTATPIPRTLHFSLMGARDLSTISTPPPNRQPVITKIQMFQKEFIRDVIHLELRRGGQVFFVHNRISDIEQIASLIFDLVPDARIGLAHGQMEGVKLQKTMMRFIEGDFNVLVSTNIIESGLDIPNANTILINNAHMFGLSDLHQMRGRVGRSNKKAFCYLLTGPTTGLTSDARKRINTLEGFSDLGDGFKIAMRDLDIRGAGNLLGAEQSGFINDLGFDAYHKILDQAVRELKETKFKNLFVKELSETAKLLLQDCSIETDLEILIPNEYVNNISERLNLYNQLDNIKSEEKLQQFTEEIKDRFGPIPEPVYELIDSVRLRWSAQQAGFEKLLLKDEKLKGYFVPQENEKYYKSEVFGKILVYVQKHSKRCKMKEVKQKLLLTIEDVQEIKTAKRLISEMIA